MSENAARPRQRVMASLHRLSGLRVAAILSFAARVHGPAAVARHDVPAGTRFAYASPETQVLGVASGDSSFPSPNGRRGVGLALVCAGPSARWVTGAVAIVTHRPRAA